VFFGLFYVGAFLGTLVTVWRSRTLPRAALLLVLLFLLSSILDVPAPVTAIELVACVWFAVAIVRAPQREGQGARSTTARQPSYVRAGRASGQPDQWADRPRTSSRR
jgi:hypothetical protein